MTRLRSLALAAGSGALLAGLLVGLPAAAAPQPASRSQVQAQAQAQAQVEARAMALLGQAAHAASTRSWSGTQYVGTWRGAAQTSAVLEVSHRPGSGSTVRTAGGKDAVVVPELDARLLSLLADHYDLAVTGSDRCAGRAAHVVAARRDDGSVAGRFWLDTDTGLVLRREVYDAQGGRLASSAFVDLQVAPAGARAVRTPPQRPAPEVPTVDWRPPRELPGGLELFDVRTRRHDGASVLHLAYSDGLSTLSLFAQPGSLPEAPREGFRTQELRGTRAHVQPTAPERIVWQGDGQVFTLVSDAAPDVVRDALEVLPRDPAPRDGLLARLGRGASRLGSWLNPFD